jgi:outer membrane protein assembly factor BamD
MSFRWLILACFAFSLVACATDSDNPADKYKGFTAKQLFNSGLVSMSKSEYKTAIEHFEALDARYPFGKYAEKEQLYIIYAYYKADQYPEALAATERYLHLHPDGAHVDYAYFVQGVMNYQQNLGVFERYFPADVSQRDLKPARQSYLEFMTLINEYPKSAYRANATQYTIYIRNLVAEQITTTANFYYKRKAYVAAANRANEVIMSFDGAPTVSEALYIAAMSYHQLKLEDIADMYYRVIKLNYPESSYLKRLQKAGVSADQR